jgi:antitoxin component of RelBE/YafQ-DinJ toxin-antitoxin module
MENKVVFNYDRSSQILFVEDHWDVQTVEDVEAFFAEYEQYIRAIKEKFWMIAHIDDLIIHAEVAEYYGERARKATSSMILGLARWGQDSSVRMALRTTAMKSRMPLKIYSSRAEAIRAIEQMKAERAGTRRS